GKQAVDVMNNTAKKSGDLTADINVLDANSKSVLKKSLPVSELESLQTKEAFTLPDNLNVSKTYFLDLRLFDKQHQLWSNNFYVLSTQKDSLAEKKITWYITPQSQYADLTLLEKLPKVKLQKSETVSQKGENTIISVKMKNPSQHVAFMVYMDLKKGQSNESVVPVFWKENYFTLLPGEERTVSVSCHTTDLAGQKGRVVVGGWNVE